MFREMLGRRNHMELVLHLYAEPAHAIFLVSLELSADALLDSMRVICGLTLRASLLQNYSPSTSSYVYPNNMILHTGKQFNSVALLKKTKINYDTSHKPPLSSFICF